MPDKLLICTDLDRTLIPNGPQPESPMSRQHFKTLASHENVVLAYVTGRHRQLVQNAIANYQLPMPNFVIGDVGTSIFKINSPDNWQKQSNWDHAIATDWNGKTSDDLKHLLQDIAELRLQEPAKQNRYKLSYYVPLNSNQPRLAKQTRQRLENAGIKANLVWSVDEPNGIGLLDILPAGASKFHAIEALMQNQVFDYSNTVFCGDSGNDLEVLSSPIASVLVANSQPEVREQALQLAEQSGHTDRLYIARGGFMSMNGNYSGGMLEGIAYYYPYSKAWMQHNETT